MFSSRRRRYFDEYCIIQSNSFSLRSYLLMVTILCNGTDIGIDCCELASNQHCCWCGGHVLLPHCDFSVRRSKAAFRKSRNLSAKGHACVQKLTRYRANFCRAVCTRISASLREMFAQGRACVHKSARYRAKIAARFFLFSSVRRHLTARAKILRAPVCLSVPRFHEVWKSTRMLEIMRLRLNWK